MGGHLWYPWKWCLLHEPTVRLVGFLWPLCVFIENMNYHGNNKINYFESIESKYSTFFLFSRLCCKANFISCNVPFNNLFISPLGSTFNTGQRYAWGFSIKSPQSVLHGFESPLLQGSGLVMLLILKMSFWYWTVEWLFEHLKKIYQSYDPHRSRDLVFPVCGIFTESALRPIQSVSRDVRPPVRPSHPRNHASRRIRDLWSKGVSLILAYL